jgi:hypothetical protein
MTTPTYNGTSNADDTLVTPWYIPGWTAQAIPADTIPAVGVIGGGENTGSSFSPQPLPDFLQFVQVCAPYFDMDGNPLPGFVTFLMSDGITLTANGFTYRLPARYSGADNTLTPGGMNNWGNGKVYIRIGLMSVTLFATDNSTIVTDSGNPLTYHVVEHFPGGQQYDIAVPAATVSPADLRSLMVSPADPYDYDPANPGGIEVTS